MAEAPQTDTAKPEGGNRGIVINLFTASEKVRELLAQDLQYLFNAKGHSPAAIIRSVTPIAERDAAVWPPMALDVADNRQKAIDKALFDGIRAVIVEEPPVMLAMAATAQNHFQYLASERALATLQKRHPSINLLVRTGHPYDKVVEDMIENGLLRNNIGFDQVMPSALGITAAARECVLRALDAGLVQTNPYTAAATAAEPDPAPTTGPV